MTPVWTPADYEYMKLALQLAASQSGRTGTNPAVGCVIVLAGKIIGQGATGDGGRPHGEAVALASLPAQGPNAQTQGATVYVTLEPCDHVSPRGPDCTGALIDARVARVVCCVVDPDPRTAGKGLKRLSAAGIMVELGLFATEGHAQIEGFVAHLGL